MFTIRREVQNSRLTRANKDTYRAQAWFFLRWLEGNFEPGQNVGSQGVAVICRSLALDTSRGSRSGRVDSSSGGSLEYGGDFSQGRKGWVAGPRTTGGYWLWPGSSRISCPRPIPVIHGRPLRRQLIARLRRRSRALLLWLVSVGELGMVPVPLHSHNRPSSTIQRNPAPMFGNR